MSTDRSSISPEEFAELLARARQGDLAAKSQLLKMQEKNLLEIAGRAIAQDIQRCIDPSDAVQETLILAYRKFENFRGDTPKAFSAWLWTILISIVRHFARSARGCRRVYRQREIPLDDPSVAEKFVYDPGLSGIDALIHQEDGETIRRCLDSLPGLYRQVLQLRYEYDSGFKEIGATLGVSAEAARKLRGRALETFSELMRDHGIIEEED